MESTQSETVSAAGMPAAEGASLSVWQRAVAIFTRPAAAWAGLERRSQWWFPLSIMIVVSAGFAALLHERALLPMIMESWEQAVADGRMTPAQVDRAESFMRGPIGMCMTIGQQVIFLPILMLLSALMVWFGVAFILGKKFRYRLAFEVVAWSMLVTIPAQLITAAIAWSKETMKGVHVGFGILVPDSDPPSKIGAALGFFLDAIGPLSLWYLAVVIIGAATLSGAPRKSTAWTVGGLYLVLVLFFAALTAVFTKG
jgi:hypothetical protein